MLIVVVLSLNVKYTEIKKNFWILGKNLDTF